MPEKTTYTLYQINSAVKRAIDIATASKSFWVKAELAAIKPSSSGHTYLELVQTENGSTIAKAKANIWSKDLPFIKKELGADFANILKEGSEILFEARVSFHVQYGYSLSVISIDKDFALGDLERRKREVLERLQKEGIIGRNRALPIPIAIQHVIIIGSSESAGYQDFIKQIDQNPYKYRFDHHLIHTGVQGDAAKKDIVAALIRTKRIPSEQLENAVIVMIRGGGSKFDLDIFNDYDICKLITEQSFPVYTGIGHEIDQTISDLVAHTSHKTPSAVGAHIVSHNDNFETNRKQAWIRIKDFALRYYKQQHTWFAAKKDVFSVKSMEYTKLRRGSLHTLGNRIIRRTNETLHADLTKLLSAHQTLKNRTHSTLTVREPASLRLAHQKLQQSTIACLNLRKSRLDRYTMAAYLRLAQNKLEAERRRMIDAQTFVQFADPDKLSARGFGIIRKNGKILGKDTRLEQGDLLHIRAFGTSYESEFIKYLEPWNPTQRMNQRLKSWIKF